MKTYFSDHKMGWSLTRVEILEHMREYNIAETKVIEAIPMTDIEFFSCRAYLGMCAKPPEGDACGKSCEEYEPRNGKWGICKHYGKVYEEGEGFVLHEDGRLVKIKTTIE